MRLKLSAKKETDEYQQNDLLLKLKQMVWCIEYNMFSDKIEMEDNMKRLKGTKESYISQMGCG